MVLQDTLTFETFLPGEVLKRALKFEQSKQTTQAFQKSNTVTASAGQVHGTMKIKQEPIMNIGNKNANGRRQSSNTYKREQLRTEEMGEILLIQKRVLDVVGYLEKDI